MKSSLVSAGLMACCLGLVSCGSTSLAGSGLTADFATAASTHGLKADTGCVATVVGKLASADVDYLTGNIGMVGRVLTAVMNGWNGIDTEGLSPSGRPLLEELAATCLH